MPSFGGMHIATLTVFAASILYDRREECNLGKKRRVNLKAVRSAGCRQR